MKTAHFNIRLKDGAGAPEYKSIEAAGMDLHAFIPEKERILKAGGSRIVSTGLTVQLTPGYEAEVRGRSGLNFNNGIIVPTGTIDSDYRGTIMVKLYNLSEEDFVIKDGDRIAQLIIHEVTHAFLHQTESLGQTERGSNGFGSTGL